MKNYFYKVYIKFKIYIFISIFYFYENTSDKNVTHENKHFYEMYILRNVHCSFIKTKGKSLKAQ